VGIDDVGEVESVLKRGEKKEVLNRRTAENSNRNQEIERAKRTVYGKKM
jgi:hypothetical protein